MNSRLNELGAKHTVDGVEFSVGMWVKVIKGAYSGLEGYIKEIFINDTEGCTEFTCFLDYPCETTRAIVEARFSSVLKRKVYLQELGIENTVLRENEVYPADRANTYCITGIGSLDINELIDSLRKLGLKDFHFNESTSLEAYIHSLPGISLPGFADKISDWIRTWGNGGGDYSTECCIRDACNAADDNISVKELAKVINGEIADYSKAKHEAASLIELMFNEVLSEYETGGDLCEVC